MNGLEAFGDEAWFAAWFQAFAPSSPRYALPLRGLAGPAELMPGQVRVFRRGWRFLCAPANSHSPKYGWAFVDPPTPADLHGALLETLRASLCHGIEITFLPEQSATCKLLEAMASAYRWTSISEVIEHTAVVDTRGDWDTYLRTRTKNLRKTLNAQERQLSSLGTLAFRDASHDPDWPRWLQGALELEAAGWKGQAGSALAQHPNEVQFYHAVARAAVQKGRLRLNVLTLNDRLIAFQFAIVENNAFFWLKTAYDEALDRYGPGSIIAKLSIKESFEDPNVSTFYLPGPGAWKHRWANTAERLVRIRLIPPGSLLGYLLRSEVGAERLRDRLLGAFGRLPSMPVETQVPGDQHPRS